ncbi:LTA synthase family protein [Planococcus lenghuensis]|uniref:Phosphoglycerol transferase n=1 Tax=Planococcus lenghuensis TaxID=2213202 RepID=A0A1Q2KY51_9BACL|nr:LTA synthase family protein [Planococcus lenghuensis]AQQ53131.1 phosphoglycerol transferase [Planococcus lenghuensis]
MNKLLSYLSAHLFPVSVASLWLKTVLVSGFAFGLSFSSWLDPILLLISPVGPLLLAAGSSFLFSHRFRPAVLLIVMIAVTFLLYGNLLYYRFYVDFVTLPVLFQLDNVGGLSSSTVELLAPYDVLLFIDLVLVGWAIRKHPQPEWRIPKRSKIRYVSASTSVLVISLLMAFMQNPHVLKATYDREQLVKSLGLYNYQAYNILVTVNAPVSRAFTDPADIEEIEAYFSAKTPERSDLFGAAKGKNVVFVSLESTQDFVIGQKIHGEEVTPFLNELIEDSFYFSTIYNQTAQGKTSDAEFIVDTGLYPLASGSVFVRYPENTFLTLPHILDREAGYSAAVFHGNDRSFWNRDEAYKAFGYDFFFSERDYRVTEENSVNYGIKDIPFFEQSMDELADLPEPYFAKFITLTNHFPFLLSEEEQLIAPADTDIDVVNRYVTTVRYQDEALKRFFALMKERGMYEDALFVIYGDHYGISEEYEAGVHQLLGEEDTVVNHVKLQQVPLIIHLPGTDGAVIDTVGGQIDIRSTVLHLLGIPTDDFLSFSQDLFTRKNEPVIFRDGSMVTEEVISHDRLCYRADTGQQIENKQCSSHEEEIREQLELSDRLIMKDLLRFTETD